jgi:hypothetical protein
MKTILHTLLFQINYFLDQWYYNTQNHFDTQQLKQLKLEEEKFFLVNVLTVQQQ